ncbi:hypothetical protein ABZ915_17550 [Streptomyces sp. NPDC046915]|uniref:hypothetical protein n=1 Tax=Streptomyces sp. NPDC046915 TaxID=3155257 RepID=UPI0033C491C4
MNQPDPKPMSVEERVARHLAAKDWLTTEDHWDHGSASFRADYLAHAREVIAIVRDAAQPPADRAALRDRIRYAMSTAPTISLSSKQGPTEITGELDEIVAAVLAALSERAERAAVFRQAADELGRMDYDTDSNDYGYDTFRDAWNGGVMDAAAELRRLAGGQHATDTEAHCICGHPVRQHFEDACLIADCDCGDCMEPLAAFEEIRRLAQIVRQQSAAPAADLPEALEAVLTKRFTELGNQFAEMRVHEQGPDGWPSSRLVSPRMVAEVLRGLVADEQHTADEARQQGAIARCDQAMAGKVHPPHDWEPYPGKGLWHCPGDEPFAI